jgi:hypothetical protein
MRRVVTVLTLLVPALVLPGAVVQADGIRPTSQYQRLSVYVNQLEQKKDQQQQPDRIDAYRDVLDDRAARARLKVRELYQKQLRAVRERRDARKARVASLQQRRDGELAQLRSALQSRLNALESERRAAVARVNGNYAARIDELDRELAKLQRKLAKATRPLVRESLREQIAATEQEERDLAQERIADINATNNRFDSQEEVAREDYAERIQQSRDEANADIRRLRERWQVLYRSGKSNAQTRRAENFGIVRTKHDEGVGYIDVMPHVGDVTPVTAP